MKKLLLLSSCLSFMVATAQSVDLPYASGFETTPGDWTFFNASTENDYKWEFYHSALPAIVAYEGDFYAGYSGDFGKVADAWLFSTAFNMTAGQQCIVSFWYCAPVDFFDHSLKITIGSDKTVAAQNAGAVLFENTTINNPDWQRSTSTFTAPIPGTYVLGIHAYNNAHSGIIAIDDLQITDPLSTTTFLASEFSVHPNPTSGRIAVSGMASGKINKISITDSNGRIVKLQEFGDVSNAELNISDLSSGIYIMSIGSEKGTAIKKIIKQ